MHKSMLEERYTSVNDSLRYRNSWVRLVVKLQHIGADASLGIDDPSLETTQDRT